MDQNLTPQVETVELDENELDDVAGGLNFFQYMSNMAALRDGQTPLYPWDGVVPGSLPGVG